MYICQSVQDLSETLVKRRENNNVKTLSCDKNARRKTPVAGRMSTRLSLGHRRTESRLSSPPPEEGARRGQVAPPSWNQVEVIKLWWELVRSYFEEALASRVTMATQHVRCNPVQIVFCLNFRISCDVEQLLGQGNELSLENKICLFFFFFCSIRKSKTQGISLEDFFFSYCSRSLQGPCITSCRSFGNDNNNVQNFENKLFLFHSAEYVTSFIKTIVAWMILSFFFHLALLLCENNNITSIG